MYSPPTSGKLGAGLTPEKLPIFRWGLLLASRRYYEWVLFGVGLGAVGVVLNLLGFAEGVHGVPRYNAPWHYKLGEFVYVICMLAGVPALLVFVFLKLASGLAVISGKRFIDPFDDLLGVAWVAVSPDGSELLFAVRWNGKRSGVISHESVFSYRALKAFKPVDSHEWAGDQRAPNDPATIYLLGQIGAASFVKVAAMPPASRAVIQCQHELWVTFVEPQAEILAIFERQQHKEKDLPDDFD